MNKRTSMILAALFGIFILATQVLADKETDIQPLRAKVPSLDEVEAAAKLMKNGLSESEVAENIVVANSWRQQQLVNDINRLKLQEIKQNLEHEKLQNELTKLQVERQHLLAQSQKGEPESDPIANISLTSIYADKQGVLKATLKTQYGDVTVRRGYKVSGLIVSEIGTQHILLLHKEKAYPMYIN